MPCEEFLDGLLREPFEIFIITIERVVEWRLSRASWHFFGVPGWWWELRYSFHRRTMAITFMWREVMEQAHPIPSPHGYRDRIAILLFEKCRLRRKCAGVLAETARKPMGHCFRPASNLAGWERPRYPRRGTLPRTRRQRHNHANELFLVNWNRRRRHEVHLSGSLWAIVICMNELLNRHIARSHLDTSTLLDENNRWVPCDDQC